MNERVEIVEGQRTLVRQKELGAGALGEEVVDQRGRQELEEAISRIEREHSENGNTMPGAVGDSEASSPSFLSIESFLNHVSKVFEDRRPAGNQGQAMDKKMYVRQVERKRAMGLE